MDETTKRIARKAAGALRIFAGVTRQIDDSLRASVARSVGERALLDQLPSRARTMAHKALDTAARLERAAAKK